MYGRKLAPYTLPIATPPIHHSDVATEASAARHAKPIAAARRTPITNTSYSNNSAGPTRTQATVAAFTPPPLAATTSAKAAGHHQLRGLRTPRCTASSSHGSAAYAIRKTDVRLPIVTT